MKKIITTLILMTMASAAQGNEIFARGGGPFCSNGQLIVCDRYEPVPVKCAPTGQECPEEISSLCGQIKIFIPHGQTTTDTVYFLEEPNKIIPDLGFFTTYLLRDNASSPVLQDLVNGEYQCVEGAIIRYDPPQYIFEVNSIVN